MGEDWRESVVESIYIVSSGSSEIAVLCLVILTHHAANLGGTIKDVFAVIYSFRKQKHPQS